MRERFPDIAARLATWLAGLAAVVIAALRAGATP